MQPFLEAENLGGLLRAATSNLIEDPQRKDALIIQFYSNINALRRAVQLEDEGILNTGDGIADYFRGQVRITAGTLNIDTTNPDYTYLTE